MIAMGSSGRYTQKLVLAVLLLIAITYWRFDTSRSSSENYQHSLPHGIVDGLHHAAPSKVDRGYSVKPLAYIFPEFYTFKENTEFHGEGFTEWVNVKGVERNRYGLETIRPHERIGGFYNGLEKATRRRQGNFLRDHGFYGAVFHHYWFDGKPIMDHVVKAMLKDGEPNVPFMLSWANDPWSRSGGDVLLEQKYGRHEAWRKHFDYLLPFFKHPQYIRSEGKVQFVMYHPGHGGHIIPQMFAAWRQWAVEEGLGGMDIIETRWGQEATIDQWKNHMPDAVNEFHPNILGEDTSRFYDIKRISRVYHRGTLTCLDTTPHHPTDGIAVANPFCHPKMWQNHMVEMLRIIKEKPNPIGVENFLFVNALNAWGEGNALEPSAQFGTGYGDAMIEALEISEREHIWPDVAAADGLIRDKMISTVMDQDTDVCVIVRTSGHDADDRKFQLDAMLKSLQAQTNQKWRAAVVRTNTTARFDTLDEIVDRQFDRRIKHLQMPGDVKMLPPYNDGGYMATDWWVEHLTLPNELCEGAKYFLITHGNSTYAPTAFEAVAGANVDMIGLNVESKHTIQDYDNRQNTPWDDRCSSLQQNTTVRYKASMPTMEDFDLTATFISAPKLVASGSKFSFFTQDFSYGRQPAALAMLLVTHRSWQFVISSAAWCEVFHNPALTTCLATGNFWFDSPVFHEAGCYRSSEFIKRFESDKPLKADPQLDMFDLQYFRENGPCVRYTEGAYQEAKNRPKPPPPKPPVVPVVFHYNNPDPEPLEGEDGGFSKGEIERIKAEQLAKAKANAAAKGAGKTSLAPLKETPTGVANPRVTPAPARGNEGAKKVEEEKKAEATKGEPMALAQVGKTGMEKSSGGV